MTSQGQLILVVDDIADDREMYACFLTHNGFRVILASDGEEALGKSVRLGPELIIMDLGLPGVSGWDAIRRLKSDARTQQIPIVVLTARAFVSAEAVGSDSSLVKPCPPNSILAEINRFLNADAHVVANTPYSPA